MVEWVGARVRRHRLLVVGIWVLLAGMLNVVVPQLDTVVSAHSPRFVPASASSSRTLQDMGREFHESTTSGIGYVMLERPGGLTAADRDYYRALVRSTAADRPHVESVTDLWSAPLTAASVASKDGGAVYLLVRIAGDTGTTQASQSVSALRSDVAAVPRPSGLTVQVTGPTATVADELDGVHRALLLITAITVVLIAALLFAVYRSIATAAIPLATIGLGLAVARQLVALAGEHGVAVSMFTEELLSAMILGAGTDYAIFAVSRYHEARRAGHSPDIAYSITYKRISPVLIASGVIVAVTCAQMTLAHIGLFRTIGLPCAIGVLCVMAASVTLTPALLALLSSRGLVEPKGKGTARYWQGLADTIVRRPGRMLAATLIPIVALTAVLGTLALNYDERSTQPTSTESNQGYATAARHYPGNELLPNYIVIRSDRDLRSPGMFGALETISTAVARIPGVVAVRGVTRPFGQPIPQGSVSGQLDQVGSQLGAAATALQAAAPDVNRLRDGASALSGGAQQLTDATGQLAAAATRAGAGSAQLAGGTQQLSDGLTRGVGGSAELADGARRLQSGIGALAAGVDAASAPMAAPLSALAALRARVAADPNCAADALCAAARAALPALDGSALGSALAQLNTLRGGADALASGTTDLANGLVQLHQSLITAQHGAASLLAGQQQLDQGLGALADGAAATNAGTTRLAVGAAALNSGVGRITEALTALPNGLTQASSYLSELRTDAAGSVSGGFFLPQFAMQNPDLQLDERQFISPDGHMARIVVVDSGTAFGTAAMARTQQILDTARHAAAGTVLTAGSIEVSGLTATYFDLRHMSLQDLILLMSVACALILVVLAMMLRSLVVPLYILVSVLLSYGAAMGVSVLTWQHLLGKPLHWSVPSVAFIALTAVGADYNLLLMSRVRDELPNSSGTPAAIVAALTRTGGVITTAGIVFAITMFAMLSASVTVVSQVGFTIGTGLLIDTLIVRTVMIPATAMLFGRHNWWPRGTGSRTTADAASQERAAELVLD